MANTSSAKKAIRASERKAIFNLRRKREFKDARKEALKSAKSTKKGATESAMSLAFKKIDKAAKSNTIHKKTASRYKARLAKKLASK